MIVVSEIGEQWSPQTAPAIQAEIAMIIIVSLPANASTTIGMRIPNVPHEVPLANASTHATKKMIAGKKLIKEAALPLTSASTYGAAPRLSVIAFKDHAIVRIRIAGTIALKPSGRHPIHSLKERTFLAMYKMIVITQPKKLPYARPTDASQPEKASIIPTPSKNPPV